MNNQFDDMLDVLDVESDTLVITCIDKRFRYLYDKALARLGIREPYVLSLPGASLMSRENRDELKNTIKMLSKTLTKVISIDHADCVAFQTLYGRNDESLHAVSQDNFSMEIMAINKELDINVRVDNYFMYSDGELFGPTELRSDWKFQDVRID